MSGSSNVGGKGAGITGATSAVTLPFTGGHKVISYVVLTALICAVIVLISKVVKRFATR